MNRETKIGLLVGLAFIIVIGILLSDHLTTRGEMKPAELTQVTDHVQEAVASPGGKQPPITPVIAPTDVTPTTPVMTSDELHQAPARSVVQIGGPAQAAATDTRVAVHVGPPQADDSDAVVTKTPVKGDAGNPLRGMIASATKDVADPILVPVGPSQALANTTTTTTTTAVAKPLVKEYKAVKGDTVTRWAVKFLGADTNANRKLIIDANPSLKANPARIMIGQTYLIPLPAAKQAQAAATIETLAAKGAVAIEPTTGTLEPTTSVKAAKVPTGAVRTLEVAGADANTFSANDIVAGSNTTTTTAQKAGETKSTAKSTASYTTKDRDTLWKIAQTQLGDGTLWKEIRDLNRDVLKGKDTVHPGVSLRLPTKASLASR